MDDASIPLKAARTGASSSVDLPRKGVYQLLMRLARPKRMKIGKLGRLDFSEGYYVYTGRALGGLRARIERHLRKDKKLRWHIDYFLRGAEVLSFKVIEPGLMGECDASKALMSKSGCAPVPKFGSSDCKCHSHLAYLGRDCTAFYE